jgi:hypothetical protein
MGRRLTDQERAARQLSERDFQKAYVAVLRALGFLVEHHYDSRFSDPGTKGAPDLKIVGHGDHFVVELKRWDGVVSDEQVMWLEAYEAAGVPAYVYRPQDWGTMLAQAERIAQRPIPPQLQPFPVARKRKRKKPAATT